MSSNDLDFWRCIKQRFEFCLMLSALLGCGFLIWSDVLFIIFMLIFSGIAVAEAELYNISLQKIEELENVPSSQLGKSIQQLNTVKNILNGYPEFRNDLSELINDIENAKRYNEEKIRGWWEWIIQCRAEKGVQFGCPPNKNDNFCPDGFPVRATENLKGKKYQNEPYRGIYYEPGDPDYKSEATWCFENIENAKKDRFRRSKKRRRSQ
ncbi:hypothetical protein PN462_15400 [Spirulina sp. CS-785/01]|uniref:hypothetical protein n=1 Tax=Spirulina sp. CS-785/01 TaxID=3021716 RepID=UPI0023305D5D|nr:hypothetical protein [Spirulina sp. CS-785/01]MDB9314497.1 hypothetical protein [Spirulina sp. CS-785/01]